MSPTEASVSTFTVQVRFVPKDASKYTVTDTPMAVPENLRRYALSEIVNHLLDNETPVPFDFLVDGMLLRTSVSKYLEDRALSKETVVTLEFLEATPAPETATQLPHDDWVGAVDTFSNGLIASGSYDGVVSLWSGTGERITMATEHTAAIKSLKVINDKSFVTAAQDHTIRLWSAVDSENLASQVVFKGHGGSVESVVVSPDANTCVSASFDKTLRVWSLHADSADSDEPPSKKKRKTKTATASTSTREATLILNGHTAGVTSLAFGGDNSTVYSASWDHSIRQWDLTTGTVKRTLAGGKAIQSIAYNKSSNLIISAGADKAIRLWDPRENASTMIKRTLISHTGMTSSVAWSPVDGNQFVSGAYDGDIKIWDARSTISLHTLKAVEGKVLCVAWPSVHQILSGGDDNAVHVHSIDNKTK